MLTTFTHLTTSIPPACSQHRLSFVPSSVCTSQFDMRLHTHGIHSPHHIYPACMLTAPPIICSIFCLSNPILYTPTCSRPLSTSPPLYRLHAHDTARHLPLPHRLSIHSTRTHHSTTQQHHTTLPPLRHSMDPTTAAPTSPITYIHDLHLLISHPLPSSTSLSLYTNAHSSLIPTSSHNLHDSLHL